LTKRRQCFAQFIPEKYVRGRFTRNAQQRCVVPTDIRGRSRQHAILRPGRPARRRTTNSASAEKRHCSGIFLAAHTCLRPVCSVFVILPATTAFFKNSLQRSPPCQRCFRIDAPIAYTGSVVTFDPFSPTRRTLRFS